MATWKLNGSTCESLRASVVSIERVNMGVDVCTIELQRTIEESSPWATGQRVTVSRDGTTVFTGFAQPPVTEGGPGSETMMVQLFGPWWNLERLVMTQPAPGTSGSVATQNTGRRRLFVDRSEGTRMTTRQMLAEALSYAQQKSAITGYVGLLELENGVYPPAEETVDRTVAEVIRQLMRYHVDVAIAFTGSQALRIRKRQIHTKSFTLGQSPLVSCTKRERRDLAPAGVFIRYEQRRGTQYPGGYKDAITIDHYPSTARPGTLGVVVDTVQLEPEEATPTGVARRFYDMLRTPYIIEGEATLVGEECDTELFPGSSFSVRKPGGGNHISQAFVQTVSETPETGTTHITYGLPATLSLDDLIDIVRRKHLRTRDVTDGDPYINEPPSGFLTPYLTLNRDGKWVVRMTNGVVSDGLEDYVPTWESTGISLGNATPPERVLNKGDSLYIYLRLDFLPIPNQFTVEDQFGKNFTEYALGEAGHLTGVSVEFYQSSFEPTSQAAEVNAVNGNVTAGIFYRKWGQISWAWNMNIPTLSVARSGNFEVMHRPPSRLAVLPSV